MLLIQRGIWGDGRKYEAIIKVGVSLLCHDVGSLPALDYVVGIVMCLGRFLFLVAGEEGEQTNRV